MPELWKVRQEAEMPMLALYVPDDRVVPKEFPKKCEITFPYQPGPTVVCEVGPGLLWEETNILNQKARVCLGDLSRPAG